MAIIYKYFMHVKVKTVSLKLSVRMLAVVTTLFITVNYTCKFFIDLVYFTSWEFNAWPWNFSSFLFPYFGTNLITNVLTDISSTPYFCQCYKAFYLSPQVRKNKLECLYLQHFQASLIFASLARIQPIEWSPLEDTRLVLKY